jgi:hypothetical protein
VPDKTKAVAAPSLPPLQETFVEESSDTDGPAIFVSVVLKLAVQALLSVTVTVYDPAGNAEMFGLVAPPGFQK